jgi:GMP synthase-like glutamine amidotransferase
MTLPNRLRVAVLVNSFEHAAPIHAVKDSFTTAIQNASPAAQVDFYDPIKAQVYPDPASYDLIVLSGGTADPSGSDPWVLKVQGFLRRTVEVWPKQKMMGVCWGHQTICITFGGVVGAMDKSEVDCFVCLLQGEADII